MSPDVVDWGAAEAAAEVLGIHTRNLVAARNADRVIEWAQRMRRENEGVRALSYYELAVLVGHRDPKVTAGASLEWNELLHVVETLAATVRTKVGAEKAEKAKATAKKAKGAVPDAA